MRHPLLVFTILVLCVTEGNGQACRFGPGCRYDCNCVGTCDPQAGCVGKCTQGWEGPTCQRLVVAIDQQNQGPWRLTLDKTYSIYRFQICIWNLGCHERFNTSNPWCFPRNRLTLSVGTSNQKYSRCYTGRTTSSDGPWGIIYGTCNDGNPRTGNRVRITLHPLSYGSLTLCGVLLFVCSEGWYGEMCDKECETVANCSQCDDNGLSCQGCVSGRWGTDCDQDCGYCWNNTACDKNSGHCLHSSPRCEAGHHGHYCTTPCDSGKWGDNCVSTCSENCISPACDVTTGVCVGGCHPGYTGERCDTDCPTGSWGDNCVRTCSETCLEQPCNAETGACEGGCQPGYAGKFCDTEFSVTNSIDYTGVIVGCVIGVILTALLITAVVLYVRRRQSHGSEGAAVSAENTGVTQGVPHREPPSRSQGTGYNTVTYYNMAAEEETMYENVTEKEYGKIRFSGLDTENDYTCLA